MSNIKIEYLTDSADCETCGADWAEGYKVTINGENFGDFEPIAHCFNGKRYELPEVMVEVLKYIGHSVEFIGGADD